MGPGLNSRAKEDERADGQELVLAGAAAEQPRKVINERGLWLADDMASMGPRLTSRGKADALEL